MRRSLRAPNYLNRSQLEKLLRTEIERALRGRTGLKLLDIGCGQRVYESYFVQFVDDYVGFDINTLPTVDVVGVAEHLPFGSGQYDVVLCTQVLEHVDSPPAVISEISRVLKPGGVVLLTTHGTMVYHPTPVDYWRWTQTGLVKLFNENGEFSQIDIKPIGGTFSTLAFLGAWYYHLLSQKVVLRAGPLRWPLGLLRDLGTITINCSGLLLDRILPSFARVERMNTLFLSLLIIAHKAK